MVAFQPFSQVANDRTRSSGHPFDAPPSVLWRCWTEPLIIQWTKGVPEEHERMGFRGGWPLITAQLAALTGTIADQVDD